jgi:predicted DNA-binding transcriptional regulator AlpA
VTLVVDVTGRTYNALSPTAILEGKSMTATNNAQQAFDERYITSTEVMEMLGVTRTAIHMARITGKLPAPINVKDRIFIWERASVMPYLTAWKTVLDVRRGAGQ